MNFVIKAISGLLIVAYPFIIYFGIEYIQPRYLAVLLGVILCGQYFFGKMKRSAEKIHSTLLISVVGLLIVIVAMVNNSVESLKIYPVIVNLSMLLMFGYSLVNPPSLIERIARLTDPDLSESGVRYTRVITIIWCVFFIFNGAFSLLTALYASLETWTFYNGFFSYVMMGCLLGGEFIFRKYVLKK